MNYIYTKIKNSKYIGILTMLDYRDPVISCVLDLYKEKGIPKKNKTIIIDSFLRTGNESSRFMSFKNSSDGSPCFDYRINVEDFILNKANDILKSRPEIVKNSILSKLKQDSILKNNSKIRKENKNEIQSI